MSGIDPLRLAQFMVLPGASELVDAFSAIPPGPVRDSVVQHARVLAEASGWNAPMPFTMEPETARVLPPPRLESPFAGGLVSTSVEGQIVERAMRGEASHVIADSLGIKLGVVVRAMRKAREEGHIVFPGDEPKEIKPPPAKPKSKKGQKLKIKRTPIPNPPWWFDDPDSPVWNDPDLLPTFSEVTLGTMAAVGPHDRRTYAVMQRAAASGFETLQSYINRRREIVRRYDTGERPSDIAIDMRIAGHKVYGVLTAVGKSWLKTQQKLRAEALNAPPTASEPPPEPAAPKETPSQPTLDEWPPEPASSSGLHQQTVAAQRWGYETLADFNAVRMRIRAHRLEGHRVEKIARDLDIPLPLVRTVVDYWKRQRGVKFPSQIRRVA
jgi:hypothetical protein